MDDYTPHNCSHFKPPYFFKFHPKNGVINKKHSLHIFMTLKAYRSINYNYLILTFLH